MLITGQPIEIAVGPPLFHAWPKVVKHPRGADDREGDREVGEAAPAAMQLLLVAQLGERCSSATGLGVRQQLSFEVPPRVLV